MNDQGIQLVAELQGERGRGTSYLMNDGFLYYYDSHNDSAQYFRCKEYRRNCPGRVVFYSNGLNMSASPHNHDASDVMAHLIYKAERNSIISQANSSSFATFQDIFDDASRANPMFPRHQLLPSMIRARTSTLPLCRSLGDLSAVLGNPELACLTRIDASEEILYRGCADSNDGSHILLLASRKSIDFLRITPSVFILHIPVHLASLHQFHMCIVGGLWERSVMPLAWILAETFSEEAMLAGFYLLKSSLIHYEFSRATCAPNIAASTFARVFVVEVYPSLYDFINDIVQSQTDAVNGNKDFKQILQLCCSLPLLPTDRMQVGIDVVKANAMQMGEVTYGDAVRAFLFIEEMWMKILQNKFSICEYVERTHFGSEQLRKKMMAKFVSHQPDFYSVIRYIVNQFQKSDKRIQLLLSGQKLTPTVPIPLLQQEDLILLLQEVIRPSFSVNVSVSNFLLAVSDKIQHLF